MAANRGVTPVAGEITGLLNRLGAQDADSKLIPLVYEELRRLAARYMRRERPDHTLEPTALVHEAYLKLRDQRRIAWKSRGHFYCMAARIMRRILVDHAREVKADKRAGGRRKVTLDSQLIAANPKTGDVEAIDEALERLLQQHPRQAQVVELRYFAGCPEEEIARILNVSERTVKRDWEFARSWLYAELTKA